jgi:hypothetical protein
VKISDFMVAEQSHVLLDGLGHEVVGLYLAVEHKLEAVGAPGVSWRMVSGETSLLRAIAGRRRDFLRIEHRALREYAVVIAARPFGTALHVSWLLTASPRLANELRRAVRIGVDRETRSEIGSELDLLDALDWSAFVSLTRLALRHALRELTGDEVDERDRFGAFSSPEDLE